MSEIDRSSSRPCSVKKINKIDKKKGCTISLRSTINPSPSGSSFSERWWRAEEEEGRVEASSFRATRRFGFSFPRKDCIHSRKILRDDRKFFEGRKERRKEGRGGELAVRKLRYSLLRRSASRCKSFNKYSSSNISLFYLSFLSATPSTPR